MPLALPIIGQLMSALRLSAAMPGGIHRYLHSTPALAKNKGKPRAKTIPVATAAKRTPRDGSSQALLNLTPEALKKNIEDRNAAELADPRRGRKPDPNSCHLRDLFEPRRLPLAEVLRRHREFACPEMLNNPSGRLYATCLFDMTAGKSGKFTAPFSKVIRLPHLLPDNVVRQHNVIAFCSSPESAEELKAKGAVDAGGLDLINKLETGVYILENFDYVICHPDFWPSLLKARKLLKDAMPQQRSSQVTEDLVSALELYKHGLPVKLVQAGDLPDRAQCRVPFGLLDWPDYNIDMNLAAIVSGLLAEKPKRSSREFLLSVAVTCPPSDELFLVDWQPYLAAGGQGQTGSAAGANAESAAAETETGETVAATG